MSRGVAALLALALVALAPLGAATAQPSATPILRIEPGMHTDQVRRIAATADGESFVTISADKTARVWGVDGTLLRTLRPPIEDGAEGTLRALAISSERQIAVVAGATGAAWGREALVYIFALDRDRMQRLPSGVGAEVSALAFAPGGQLLVIGFDGHPGLVLFNFESGERLITPALGFRGAVTGLAFDAAGNLAVGTADGLVHLFNPRFQPVRPARQLPEGGRPGDLAFSPDGRLLAVGLANMPGVRLLDARTLEPRGAPPLGNALGQVRQSLEAVAWTSGPGNQQMLHAAGYVLTPQGQSAVLRWGNLAAPPLAVTPAGNDRLFSLASLPGAQLAFAGGEPIWGVIGADARPRLRLERQGGDFRQAGAGLFRERPDGTEFGLFPDRGPGSFRVSPDGMVVEFGMQRGGQQPLRFDVVARSLEPAAPVPPALAAAPAQLPLRGWVNGTTPFLGQARLALDAGETARSAVPLPDGSGFLLGTDTNLRRYDNTGREVARVATPATVWGVRVSADGATAVLALGDGTIRWHELDHALRERAALFVHRDARRWILWTPEGLFDHADGGGQDLAGFHLNRRVQDSAEWVNFAQLHRVFYAADLVRLRLARGDERPIRERLAQIGDARQQLRRRPAPSVAIVALCYVERSGEERCQDHAGGAARTRGLARMRESSAPQPAAAAAASQAFELPPGVTRVRLRAQIADRGGGVGQTDLILNTRNIGRTADTRGLGRVGVGQTAGAAANPVAGAAQTGLLDFDRLVELDPGLNTIQVRAFDAENDTFGQSAVLELRAAAPPPPATRGLPVLHVLSIGVDDYAATSDAGLRPLFSAVADARALVGLLQTRLAGDYSRINPILLADREASLAGIEAAFTRLRDEAKPEDTVLVYLAGHGLAMPERYVFIPFLDGTADLDGAVRRSLDDRRLIELWSGVPARNTMLLIDTCHAGAFSMDFAGTLQNETGRLVLAAASAQQVAADRVPGFDHGPFSLAVQEALLGQAARRLVSGGTDQLSLGFHVRDRVPDLARRARVEQRVSFRLTNGELPSPFLLTRQAP